MMIIAVDHCYVDRHIAQRCCRPQSAEACPNDHYTGQGCWNDGVCSFNTLWCDHVLIVIFCLCIWYVLHIATSSSKGSFFSYQAGACLLATLPVTLAWVECGSDGPLLPA